MLSKELLTHSLLQQTCINAIKRKLKAAQLELGRKLIQLPARQNNYLQFDLTY